MNEMQVFQNSEFGELGVLEIESKLYFPAKAAAKILGYKDTINAIKQHCKGVVKHHLPTNGGMQTMNFIPEGDLYRLITHSKLPAAERFEKWVFDDVLPTIRKTGGYGNQLAGLTNLVEQLTQVTANLIQAATAITVAVSTLVEKRAADTWEPQPNRFFPVSDGYNATRCKLETFPSEITEQVDGMLADMLQQQALNFSMIARYCTINGYTITSPAVKTYFQRHFNEA